MADDQVTIGTDYRFPSRSTGRGSDPRPSRSSLVPVVIGATLLFVWLVNESRPTGSESFPETPPITVTTAMAAPDVTPTNGIVAPITDATAPFGDLESDPPRPSAWGWQAEFEVFAGGLGTPNDPEFDPAGQLYVTETGARRVSAIEIRPNGSAGSRIEVASGITDAEGLELAGDGALYVAGQSAVYRVADGLAAPFVRRFNDPEGLAIDRNGDLYVADDTDEGIRITRIPILGDGSADSRVTVAIVPRGDAGDIAFGPDGDLYVADGRDTVWAIDVAVEGMATPVPLATFPVPPHALALDPAGTLFVAGEGGIFYLAPDELPVEFADGLDAVEGLAFDSQGNLYAANVGTNEIFRFLGAGAVDASGAIRNWSTTPPDIVGALPGDDGLSPRELGAVDELPAWAYLDFLSEVCEGGEHRCYRDAALVDPASPDSGVDWDLASRPFYVRHGFINNNVDPLGPGFDVVLYLTRWTGPDPAGDLFELGRTYRFSSDYVFRGHTDECGPTYRTRSETDTCDWFVHEFAVGLPEGRYDLWAVWEAPCSAWIELGFTAACEDPDAVTSMFSSGVNSPFGSEW